MSIRLFQSGFTNTQNKTYIRCDILFSHPVNFWQTGNLLNKSNLKSAMCARIRAGAKIITMFGSHIHPANPNVTSLIIKADLVPWTSLKLGISWCINNIFMSVDSQYGLSTPLSISKPASIAFAFQIFDNVIQFSHNDKCRLFVSVLSFLYFFQNIFST